MSYLKRTEANCGLGLGDNQRFVGNGDVISLDETDPTDRKTLDDLSSWTHGWEQVDASGAPLGDGERWVRGAPEPVEFQPTEPGAYFEPAAEVEPQPDDTLTVDFAPPTPD